MKIANLLKIVNCKLRIDQRGEIATVLTLVSVGLMLMGLVVGNVAVQQTTKTQSRAYTEQQCRKCKPDGTCESKTVNLDNDSCNNWRDFEEGTCTPNTCIPQSTPPPATTDTPPPTASPTPTTGATNKCFKCKEKQTDTCTETSIGIGKDCNESGGYYRTCRLCSSSTTTATPTTEDKCLYKYCGSKGYCDPSTGNCVDNVYPSPHSNNNCTYCKDNKCFYDPLIDPRSGRAPAGTAQCQDKGCVSDAECTPITNCAKNGEICGNAADNNINCCGEGTTLHCNRLNQCEPIPIPTPVCNDIKTETECKTKCGSRGCEQVPFSGGFFNCWRCNTKDYCGAFGNEACAQSAGKPTPILTPSVAPTPAAGSPSTTAGKVSANCSLQTGQYNAGKTAACFECIAKNEKYIYEGGIRQNDKSSSPAITDSTKCTDPDVAEYWCTGAKPGDQSEGKSGLAGTNQSAYDCKTKWMDAGKACASDCAVAVTSSPSPTPAKTAVVSTECKKNNATAIRLVCTTCIINSLKKANKTISSADSSCSDAQKLLAWCQLNKSKSECRDSILNCAGYSNATSGCEVKNEGGAITGADKIIMSLLSYSNEDLSAIAEGMNTGKYNAIVASLYVANATRSPGLQRLYCDPYQGQCDFYNQQTGM